MAKWKTLCQDVSITMARWRADSLTADKVHSCCLNRLKPLERLGSVDILRPGMSRNCAFEGRKEPLQSNQIQVKGRINKSDGRSVKTCAAWVHVCVQSPLVPCSPHPDTTRRIPDIPWGRNYSTLGTLTCPLVAYGDQMIKTKWGNKTHAEKKKRDLNNVNTIATRTCV